MKRIAIMCISALIMIVSACGINNNDGVNPRNVKYNEEMDDVNRLNREHRNINIDSTNFEIKGDNWNNPANYEFGNNNRR